MSETDEYEWLPEPSGWSTSSEDLDGRLCRQPNCGKPAVAVMFRHTGGWKRRQGVYRWGCCEDHMYGRRVRDGVVENSFLRGSIAHARAKEAARREETR